MLLNGRTLEEAVAAHDVIPGAAYRIDRVESVVQVITPWQRACATIIPLTGEQQRILATEDYIVLPLLCYGPEGAHTHNIALTQGE